MKGKIQWILLGIVAVLVLEIGVFIFVKTFNWFDQFRTITYTHSDVVEMFDSHKEEMEEVNKALKNKDKEFYEGFISSPCSPVEKYFSPNSWKTIKKFMKETRPVSIDIGYKPRLRVQYVFVGDNQCDSHYVIYFVKDEQTLNGCKDKYTNWEQIGENWYLGYDTQK